MKVIIDGIEYIPKHEAERVKTKRFIKPTEREVFEYASLKNLNLIGFFDYYESISWRVGKKQMTNWKSAASGWSKRQLKNRSKNSNDFMIQPNFGDGYFDDGKT